jgi:hypothetical protein
MSGITITLAIPTSVGTRPTVTVDNSPNTNITYLVYNAIDQNIQGTPHYIYNLLGDGNVGAAVPAVTYTAGTDNLIVKASFSGSSGVNSLVKMVNLPDGGSDPNPNSFFGLSIDGNDMVNESSMFYSIPTFSTANNNILPGGYSGLSQAETTELVPVPVKFRGFTVIKKDNNALLNWTVESESPVTDRYEVERSVNGVDFTKIATVLPKPLNGGTNSYDLTDFNLSSIRSSGVIYYRIKQVDRDGKFVYTEIRSVRLDGKSFVMSIYPNPVKTTANLIFDLPEAGDIALSIVNGLGQEVQRIQLQGNKGVNIQKINFTPYAAGTYTVKVTSGGEIRALSIVKAE